MLSGHRHIIYLYIVFNPSPNTQRIPPLKRHHKNNTVHNIFVLLVALHDDVVTVVRDIEVANVVKLAVLNDFVGKFCLAKLAHHTREAVDVGVITFFAVDSFGIEPFFETIDVDVHHGACAFARSDQHVVFAIFFIKTDSACFGIRGLGWWLFVIINISIF